MFAQRHKTLGPREEYRQQEGQRISNSISLSEKFQKLKSLMAELEYCEAGSTTRKGIKYTYNLESAKSVFRFNCPNEECVGGDFDLSEDLAKAIAEHRTTLTGESFCQGWLSKTTIDKIHCHSVLHYKLTLA